MLIVKLQVYYLNFLNVKSEKLNSTLGESKLSLVFPISPVEFTFTPKRILSSFLTVY